MNIKREVDYEWAERQAYNANLKEFQKNPFQPDSLKRMQNYAKKHFLSIELILKKVQEDDIFARIFVKDPIRQSIHENEAAKFIKENNLVCNFKKLPAASAQSLFLYKGKIISKKEKDELKLPLKSVDFYWELKLKNGEKIKFYASHKYTNEEGGIQDHQYIEQRTFLKNAKQSKMGDNVFFLALCEGQYYRKLNKKDSHSRIDYMNKNDKSKQAYALPLCDLDEYLAQKVEEFTLKAKQKDEVVEEKKRTATKEKRKIKNK